VAQFTAIHPKWAHWSGALSLAIFTWAADLTCFVVSLHAVGIGNIGVGPAAAAYSAGLATTSLSLLPGGIGTVETGMMIGLSHAGIAGSRAVAGIVTYRLVAYVLVAGIGWTVYAGLRRGQPPRALRVSGSSYANRPAREWPDRERTGPRGGAVDR
jgi:uncharacterized membrane protein YbhN (UPF0104 family)